MNKIENIKEMNIYQKLHYVQQQVNIIQKEKKGNFQYDYASTPEVMLNFNPAIVNARLRLDTTILKATIHEKTKRVLATEYKNNKKEYLKDKEGNYIYEDKISYMVELEEIEFKWTNIDKIDEQLVEKWFGYGFDDFEKGLGRALSYSQKYYLLAKFQIATLKDDPDFIANKKSLENKLLENSFETKNVENDTLTKALEDIALMSSSNQQIEIWNKIEYKELRKNEKFLSSLKRKVDSLKELEGKSKNENKKENDLMEEAMQNSTPIK